MKPKALRVASIAILFLLVALVACGGGSSSGGSTPPPPPPPALVITTASPLPGTLQNYPYTAALSAAHGQGTLQWSIAPISTTSLFVDGLSIDPSTGILSGIAN